MTEQKKKLLLIKYSVEHPEIMDVLAKRFEEIHIISPYHEGLSMKGNEREWKETITKHDNVFIHFVKGNEVTFSIKVLFYSRKLKFDVILVRGEVWGLGGAFVKLISRKKLVSFISLEILEVHKKTKKKSLKYWIERGAIHLISWLVLGLSDAVVVPSKKLENSMMKRTKKVFRSQFPGVDIDMFSRRSGRKKLKEKYIIPLDKEIIGYVGRLSPEKNPMILVDVIKLSHDMNNIHLLIVGDGPDREKIENRIKSEKVDKKVTLMNYQPHNKIPEIMSLIDIFVQPSLSEAFGSWSAIEAMSCGIPIVSTHVGGIADYLLDEENALIVQNPMNAIEYLEKIKKLEENKELRMKIEKKGRITAKKYSREEQEDKFIQILMS